ncbi:flagellar hook-length control protein FliK [Termitidicoccus mucosus]|uniref:Uncharacterized protein n=1 Tax=Termitidicoccus mucosus TaxID=1184151 RepID=A0A178IF34_9BACT|nr:hypothetical protein AW736_16295 [Opitutaceae bacterium TSB47]
MTVSANIPVLPAEMAPPALPVTPGNPEAAGDGGATAHDDFEGLMEQVASGENGRPAVPAATSAIEDAGAPCDEDADGVAKEEDDSSAEEKNAPMMPGLWMPGAVADDSGSHGLDTLVAGSGDAGGDDGPQEGEADSLKMTPGPEGRDARARLLPDAGAPAIASDSVIPRGETFVHRISRRMTNADAGGMTELPPQPAAGTPPLRQATGGADAGTIPPDHAEIPDGSEIPADPKMPAQAERFPAAQAGIRADGVAVPDAGMARQPAPLMPAGVAKPETNLVSDIQIHNEEDGVWQDEPDSGEAEPSATVAVTPDRAAYFAGRNFGLLRGAGGRADAAENNTPEPVDNKHLGGNGKQVGIESAKSAVHMSADSATASVPLPGPAVSGVQGGNVSSGVEAVRLVEKVIEAADGLAGTHQGKVTVEVDLEHAGPVSVEVSLRDGQLHAVFRSDSQTMRESLALAWRQHGARAADSALPWAEPQIVPSRPSGNGNMDTGGFQEQAGFHSGEERQPRPGGTPHAPDEPGPFSRKRKESSPEITTGERTRTRLLATTA